MEQYRYLSKGHAKVNQFRRIVRTFEPNSRYSTLDQPKALEPLQLPSLRSIQRSIKHNSVSFTRAGDLCKLRKEPQAQDSLAESLAHSCLLSVRKKYDSVTKERQNQELNLQLLQAERIKYEIERDKKEEERDNGIRRVKEMEEKLNKIKARVNESGLQKRVMQHMAHRLKHDRVLILKSKKRKELQFEIMAKSQQTMQKENALIEEQLNRIGKVYRKMASYLTAEQIQRETHVSSMAYMINNKIQAYGLNLSKNKQMKEIAQIALCQKDQEEKNWYRIYLCSKFVQKLLRDKMAREMNKFSSVQTTFKNIKTATGVSTTQSLVLKFLNKDSTYGDMLGKIAQEQKKILLLKAQNDNINKDHSKLKAEEQTLNIKKRQGIDLGQEQKDFISYTQRAAADYLFQERIKLWLQRNMKRFVAVGQKINLTDEPANIILAFKNYLMKLQETVININFEENPEEQKVNPQIVPIQRGNFRVGVSAGQQIVEEGKEKYPTGPTQPQSSSEFCEDHHVNQLRVQMTKGNEKYMLDLKKKHQQGKKQRIEAQPKKKQVTQRYRKAENPQIC